MRRSSRPLAVALALILLAAACGGGYSLTLTEEQKQAVATHGWNQTGRTDLDAEQWYQIVAAACEGDPDSEATRSSIVAEWELDRLVPTDDAVFALWLIAIQVCRERYPEEHQLPEGHPLQDDG